MAAPRRKATDREPESAGPATDRNKALAALANKGTVLDAARENPAPSLPALTGVEHDLGGDVRAVLTAPSHVQPYEGRRVFIYRGEVVKAPAELVDGHPGLVRL